MFKKISLLKMQVLSFVNSEAVTLSMQSFGIASCNRGDYCCYVTENETVRCRKKSGIIVPFVKETYNRQGFYKLLLLRIK